MNGGEFCRKSDRSLSATTNDVLQVFHGGARLFAPVLKGWAVLYPEFRLAPTADLQPLLVLLAVTVLPYILATLVPGWRAATADPDAVMRG